MKFNKSIFGWTMYDFANSAFVTIIVTVVYSVYFKNEVALGGEIGTALWGRAVSISMLLVAITAPILGAIADYTRSKKRLMMIMCYISVIFTALLYFVEKGNVFTGMFYFIIANFCFSSANVFYNAFLPEIAARKDLGKVSGWGWALGYVGGLSALLIIMPLIKINIRLVFPTVAVFFGGFAIFTFILLKETKKPKARLNYVKMGFRRIAYSYKNIRKLKELVKFLLSYMIYNDGITTVFTFASIFGATQFNMSTQELIVYFIIAQVTSIIGAFFFGYILDKIGAKKTISITLLIWIAVVTGAFFCTNVKQFYLVGLLAGIAMGSSQSSSRTLLALFTPDSKMSEFFGFYSVTGKLAAILGPLMYGEMSRLLGSQRYSILSIMVFFIVGGIVLQFVNETEGKKAALEWVDEKPDI